MVTRGGGKQLQKRVTSLKQPMMALQWHLKVAQLSSHSEQTNAKEELDCEFVTVVCQIPSGVTCKSEI